MKFYLIKPARIPVLMLLIAMALAALACGTSASPSELSGTQDTLIQSPEAKVPSAATQAVGDKPVELRVGAVADTYRDDPKDMSRLNIGMFPLNVNIFDQLILVDPEFQLQPMLAGFFVARNTESWRSRRLLPQGGRPLTILEIARRLRK